MKKNLLSITILATVFLKAQFSVSVQTPAHFQGKEAILYTLNGSKDIIAARENRKGNGLNFRVPTPYTGMMKVYFPEVNAAFNLISENKEISIILETSTDKINNVIYRDEANILMENIQDHQKKTEMIAPALVQIQEFYRKDSDFGKAVHKEIERLKVKPTIDATKNPFVHYYHTNYNIYLTEKPAKAPDQNEILKFIQNSGDMLETSSLLRPLLIRYMNTAGNAQVSEATDRLLHALNTETARGQTVLSELIEIFDVYSMTEMKEKYLTLAKNLKCTINDRLASTIASNKNVELGAVFPDYSFQSATNTQTKTLHSVKADKKVIVFWSSTCSHCEADLPVLLEKYRQLKDKNIEIIGLSLDSDAASYRNKIAALPWINDSELRGWNSSYTETYNISATPTYFVLDAANKIIARPDHAADVLTFLNIK